jgi:hypothetical protein
MQDSGEVDGLIVPIIGDVIVKQAASQLHRQLKAGASSG